MNTKRFKRILIYVFCLLCLVINGQDTIIIGIDNNYPPYEYTDKNGEHLGFNVDLTTHILKEYGYPYKIISNPWDITYTLFKNGKLDVVSMLFSNERSSLYNLSLPHNLVTYGIFYEKSNLNEINPINYEGDIVVIKDDIMHESLKLQINEKNIIPVANADEALKLINKDNKKIAILSKLQGLYLINKNKYSNIKLSEDIFYAQKYCFAVKKDNTELVFYLNEGLSISKEEKLYDKLYQKWFYPLEQEKITLNRIIKDYLLFLLIIGLIFLIIAIWNLTLKRALKKRNKALNEELLARERTEMAIIESEERFRTLTENSPAAIIIFNETKIFFVNNSSCIVTGYNNVELLKMSFTDLLNDDNDKKRILNYIDTTKRNKAGTAHFDLVITTKEQKNKWISLGIIKSFYKAEPVLIGTAFDITDRHDYEIQIIESRRLYSTLLDNLPGMAYQCKNDKDWTMLFISNGCIKLTEYNPEELINNNEVSYSDLIYLEDRDYVWDNVQKGLFHKKAFTIEYRIVTKSGNIKWVWEQGKHIEKETGLILEGYIVDITDRVIAKKQLAKERMEYKTMIQSIGDGVICTDTEGKINMLNHAAEKLTGWQEEEALGCSLEEVFHIINEYTRSVCESPVKKVMETGLVIGLANHTVLVSKQGKEYIISDSAAPIINDEGEITGVILVFSDNTSHKKAEDLIKQSEKNYRKLFDSANDVIFMLKEDKFTNCNEKTIEVFGYSKEELIGKTPDLVSPEYQEDGMLSKEKALSYINKAYTGEPLYFDWLHQKKDGSIIECEISLNKIELNNENYLQAIVRDITQRKEYERALSESEEKYKTLVEKANDGIAIVQDNKFIFSNNKLFELTGYQWDEVIDQAFLNFVHPSYHELIMTYNKARLERKDNVPSIYEIVAIHKSGKELNVELNSNFINYNGKPAALVVIRDITERKEQEENLKLFKATIENSSDAIGMSTPKGEHFYQNPAFDDLFGTFKKDIVLRIYKEESKKNEVFNSIMAGKPWTGEIEMVSKEGKTLNILLRAYANLDASGKVTGLVGIHTDITFRKRTEEALQKSEEKFRMLVELAADAFFQGDENGNLITVNDEALKLTGYTKEELLKMNLEELFDPKALEIEPLKYKKLETGVILKTEREVVSKDGQKIPVEMNSRKMPDGTYQSFFRDITKRKKAENAIIESETKYRQLFENITQAFALHEIITDASGKPIDYRYITVNPAFGQLTGINTDNIIGRRVRDLLPNIEEYWIETFGEVALTGKHLHYENYSADLEKYYETWVFCPQKRQFAVVFSDITERKQAEDAISALLSISQMSDKNIQEITDYALKECVKLTRSEIAFLAFTNENDTVIKLHSFSKDVFKGVEHLESSVELKLTDSSLFKKAIDTKKAVIINDYNNFENKKELPLWHLDINRVLIVPIEDNNKTVVLATVANKASKYNETDIHQLTLIIDRLWKTIQSKKYNESIQKLNIELIEKNKEMEQFVYVTSHDLRSPLVNIQGFTKVLMDACRQIKDQFTNEEETQIIKKNVLSIYKEDIDESLKYIELSTRKMDALLNGLLKLSRMGRITPNIKYIDMNLLFKDIINSFEFQLMKNNITVHIDELDDCNADEVLISQVFSNLLDNAIKFNDKPNGNIKISSKRENNKVIYIIEDNGSGIPEKYHKKIFEIFQRLNSTIIGEGLGLAIVHRIIEKHNGKIWLESEIEKGAKFFIELPA